MRALCSQVGKGNFYHFLYIILAVKSYVEDTRDYQGDTPFLSPVNRSLDIRNAAVKMKKVILEPQPSSVVRALDVRKVASAITYLRYLSLEEISYRSTFVRGYLSTNMISMHCLVL